LIPGANLFVQAIRLITPTQIPYLKFLSRGKNAALQYTPVFADPVMITASVQAVNRNKYQELGLDFQKRYIKIFTQTDIIDLARDTSGDRVIFNGRLFELNSETDWFAMDGWSSCLAVDIGPAP
jgi:hypothetical protein